MEISDWSELLPDLLIMIARRIQLMGDFMAFRGDCTSWRAAASVDNFVKSWPTVPLLMLAEKKDSDYREFYSLSRGKIWRRMPLPEAKGKQCIESRGWLITISSSGDVSLLHPFSRAQIELPNQSTFPEHDINPDPFFNVTSAVLSASPSETSDFVVVIVGGGGRFLLLWRPGDMSWTRIESAQNGAFNDVNFYKGKIYAITYGGHIWVWDMLDPPEAQYCFTINRELIDFRRLRLVESAGPEAQYCFTINRELIDFRRLRLVESAGELFVVARDGAEYDDDEQTYGVTNFRVVQLDLIKKEWKEIDNLGDMAIFVGHNGGFSLDATRFPSIIKPNCIYFTDDAIEAYTCTEEGGGKDVGVYNLEDGHIERFDDVQSFSLISPPVWVAPSF